MRSAIFFTSYAIMNLAISVAGLLDSLFSTTSSLSLPSDMTTVKLFQVGQTTIPVSGTAGSIINANAIATTILVSCDNSNLTGTDDNCQNSLTLTQGLSTWAWTETTSAVIDGVATTVELTVACQITSLTSEAACEATGTGFASVDSQATSTVTSSSETFYSSQIYFDDLVITAGVSKLNSPQATENPSGAAVFVAPPVPTGRIGMGVSGMAAAAVVAVAGLL